MAAMQLQGVRRQLHEARAALCEAAEHAAAGRFDPAYRAALRSRNLLFHATRGLAAARGEPLPEVPVVSGSEGTLLDHQGALARLDAALAVSDDAAQMPAELAGAREPYGRFLGFLRNEVGRLMRGGA
jgi:hypothetical protein